MLLSKGKYRILIFEYHHVDEVAHLIARSFIKMNPIWKAFEIDEEYAFKLVRAKIQPCCRSPHSHILVDENDKIKACTVQLDLVTYLSLRTTNLKFETPQQHEMFTCLEQIQQELEIPLKQIKYEIGEAIYCLFAAVDEDICNQQIASYLFHAAFLNGKLTGYKHYYTRITNPITQHMLIKLGGKIFHSVKLHRPDVGIEDLDVNLLTMNFSTINTQRALL